MALGIWGNRGKKCFNCGGEPFSRINRRGEMYCVKCYRRIKKYGFFKRVSADKNKIDIKGNTVYIYLYNKDGKVNGITKIDKIDIGKTRDNKFCKDGKGYVHTKTKGKAIKLHQIIIGKKEGFVIDHINGDKLDNRRINLRHITHMQNSWNNKKAKGYSFNKRRKKYIVSIMKNGKTYGGKGFLTENEAIKESKKLKLELFGIYSKDYTGNKAIKL